MARRGKTLKVEVTPYHILDIMADPAYFPHFIRRYHIALDMALYKGEKRRHPWSIFYENKPKLLYDDCIDEIKRILGMQSTSASLMTLHNNSSVMNIVLNACSDWITEKTGREPEFEIFDNTVKSAAIDLTHYAHYKKIHGERN